MLFVSKEVVSERIFILNMAADRVMFSLELGWSSINALECGLTSIFCLWLEEMDPGPGKVVSFLWMLWQATHGGRMMSPTQEATVCQFTRVIVAPWPI